MGENILIDSGNEESEKKKKQKEETLKKEIYEKFDKTSHREENDNKKNHTCWAISERPHTLT